MTRNALLILLVACTNTLCMVQETAHETEIIEKNSLVAQGSLNISMSKAFSLNKALQQGDIKKAGKIFNTIIAHANLSTETKKKFDVQAHSIILDDAVLKKAVEDDSIGQLLQQLLKDNVSHDIRTRTGNTPLMIAARAGKEEIVRSLLKRGYNVNAKRHDGCASLSFAINYPSIVELLLDNGADHSMRNCCGYTPLLSAAALGKQETVSVLLKKGADINMQDAFDRTPLMWAVQRGHTKIVTELLAKGADHSIRNKKGHTALIAAAREGHLEIMKLLFAYGVDPKNSFGQIALQWAIKKNNTAIAEQLLQYGVILPES